MEQTSAALGVDPRLLAQPTMLIGLVGILAELGNTDNIPQWLALVLRLGQVVELKSISIVSRSPSCNRGSARTSWASRPRWKGMPVPSK